MNFTNKRLQVFVSSTFTDLIGERQAAVEAILTAGHIPAGMELFTAGDESQMEVIKQWIDESDVYMLILGARYGSIEPTSGKSYTHLEFEYALSLGKPIFSCVINAAAVDRKARESGTSVLEQEHPQKLTAFRNEVTSRLVKFWTDERDVKIAVSESLAAISRRSDLRGWVRAGDEVNAPALADEIARLSKENAELRIKVSQSGGEGLIMGIRYEDLLALLKEEDVLGALLIIGNNEGDDYYDPDILNILFSPGAVIRLQAMNLISNKGSRYIPTENGSAFVLRHAVEAVKARRSVE